MKTYNTKADKARKLMQREYIKLSNHSNIFLTMTKKQELEWENNTIAKYMKLTEAELDQKLSEDGGFNKVGDVLITLGFLG
jgi:hypothetical protein